MKKQADYDNTITDLHEQLDALQYGGPNVARRVMLVDVPQLDYGPLNSHLMLGLQLGYILKRCCVFRPVDGFTGLSWLAPLSDMHAEDVDDAHLVRASFDVEQFEDVVQFDYAEFWENHRLRRFFFPWAPQEFQEMRCPRLLFDGEIQRRLTPTNELRRWLDTAGSRYHHDGPTVGVYARMTESEEELDTTSDELLAERARSIAEQNGVSTVLVAGDADYVDLFNLDVVDVQRIVLPDELPRSLPGMDSTVLRDMFELHVLSGCDWIVGRPSADIARHAAARIGARTVRCDRHSLVQPKPVGNGLSRFFGLKTAATTNGLP